MKTSLHAAKNSGGSSLAIQPVSETIIVTLLLAKGGCPRESLWTATVEGIDVTAFLLRFREPVMRLRASQECPHDESIAVLVHGQSAISAGTKTVTEIRQEAADNDPCKRSFRALHQEGN